jgi:hypothetical protein
LTTYKYFQGFLVFGVGLAGLGLLVGMLRFVLHLALRWLF